MKVKSVPVFFLDRHLSYVDTTDTEIAINSFPRTDIVLISGRFRDGISKSVLSFHFLKFLIMTVNNTKIQFWTEMIIIVSRDLCKIRNLDIALTNYSSFPVEILNSGDNR